MKLTQLAAICLTTAGIALALPATAQETPPMEIPLIAPEDVSQGQIVSFVNAMIAVERVRRAYQPRLEAAETDEARAALAREADAAAIAAVDKVVGITAAEYLAIAQAAEKSPELAARIQTRIDELRARQARSRAAPAKPAAAAEKPATE